MTEELIGLEGFVDPDDYVEEFDPESAVKDLIFEGVVREKEKNDAIREAHGGYDEKVYADRVKLARLSQSGGCILRMYRDIAKDYEEQESDPFSFNEIRSQLTFQYGHFMEDVLVNLIEQGVQNVITEELNNIEETAFKSTHGGLTGVFDSQRVVKLRLKKGYVTGRLDGIIRMDDKLYLTEFKTSNMDFKPWKEIFRYSTAEDIAEYCLTNSPRTTDKDKFYIFKYICQVNAYLESLDSEKKQEKLDSGLLIVKNKKLSSIETMHVPRIPEVQKYYRDIWQNLIYALIKKERPNKPEKYKIKSAPPCQYCPYKDDCWKKPDEEDVFYNADLLR